jgi:hypothetical protein
MLFDARIYGCIFIESDGNIRARRAGSLIRLDRLVRYRVKGTAI